jgi:hypothetical protein
MLHICKEAKELFNICTGLCWLPDCFQVVQNQQCGWAARKAMDNSLGDISLLLQTYMHANEAHKLDTG